MKNSKINKSKNQEKKKFSLISELISFSLVIIFALILRMFFIEIFYVPTGSMKNTILEGDYLLSTKYSYGFSKYSIIFSPDIFSGRIFPSEPDRGDVVIFRPPHKLDVRYIKRLIGLPGEKIEIIDGLVYINDKPIERENLGKILQGGKEYIKYKETLPNGVTYYSYKIEEDDITEFGIDSDFGPYFIPDGEYFFLGDNRAQSADSRFDLGCVPFENFIGKARFVIFSTAEQFWIDDITIIQRFQRVVTWIKSIRWSRIFNLFSQQEEKRPI